MSFLARWFGQGSDEIMGMNRRNVAGILPRNERRHYPIADDKLLCKRLLTEAGVAVAPTWATFEHFGQILSLETRLAEFDEFVVKPSQASGGRGILVIAGRDSAGYRTAGGRTLDAAQLRRHVADIVYGVYSLDRSDVAFVEPRLRPNEFFAQLFPRGLSDVRVIAVDGRAVLCMLRVPTLASDGRANLHQGALGLGVDLETGRITRGWHRGQVTHVHPDQPLPLTGRVVPDWQDILALATAAAAAVPLRYLGIDIVVDQERGPLVLEINARPGLEIQNVTGVGLRGRLQAMGMAI